MKTPKKVKPPPPATIQNFPIVGIGASAGGLDAFKRLLKAIPENSGMAYVLVQHLDPTHESILPEILQRVTNIPVHEITDDIKLAPNHIYIIPSNKILISTDGVLKLAVRDKKILTLSIDIFFNSLAEVHNELAIGVVLSGTGSDGTRGLRAIKEHGGITLAQDSESAAFDSMPQSAIHASVVDFVLPPEEMPAKLLQIVSSYQTTHVLKAEDELPKDDNFAFKQILLILHQHRGVDFTYYKQPTLQRRIARRIAIVKKKNLTDYLKFLRSDKVEQDALFQDVLIPVTSFFRDPKTFNTLCETVLPAIFRNKDADEPFRVWIAGCSTGEEAFSIAICLHEFLGNKLSHTRIQIFASDISENAIKTARTAYYSKADVAMLSEERLKNYFKKNNGGYEVNKVIRDMCVFAPHNFLKDPPFAKMDLISCRNVLIYMDNFLQKKALTVFHYALKENGILLLGKSESTSPVADLFTLFDKHEKIYTRKSVPGRFIHVAAERKTQNLLFKNKASKPEATQIDFLKSADAILLAKFTPASVVVNEQMDIVHIQGIIAPFLEQPQGKPTFNLLKMAREGLAFELRNSLHKAKMSKEAVLKENIPTNTNDKQTLVSFQVIPLTDAIEQHFLIVFEEKIIPIFEKKSNSQKTYNEDAQKRYEQLEKELSQTREDMRSITEEMEAANEELQSANEEMQSSNEEMQSLNEELETSREELQSTNEELTIVNHELLDKQEQLTATRFYAESIIATLREPLIILNKSMRIITANASFYKKFNIVEHEIEDKLFYEIQNHQWDDDTLRLLLEKVLPKKEQLTDFEINLDFPKLGKRHILMNARQIVNERATDPLILLAIEDVTDKVLAIKQIEESELFNRTIINSSPDCLKILDNEGRIQYMNFNGICLMEIDDFSTIKNKNWWTLWGKENEAVVKAAVDKALSGENATFTAFCPTQKGTPKWWNVIVSPIVKYGEAVQQIISVSRDITEQKQSEEAIQKMALHLKLATDSANVGIWSLDLVSLKLEWSDIHKLMWGYEANFEDLTYEDWYKVIVAEDKTLAFQRIEEARINKSIYQVDYRISRANDGAIVWIKSTGQYHFDEFGVAQTLSGVSIDITEQKMIDNQLTLAKTEAESALAAKQQFLANMSHEIRTPMNAIIGFTKVILKTDLSEKQKEYISAIKTSGDTLIVLIDDILDLSKVDAGKMTFVHKPFELSASITTMLHLFETKIEEKNLELLKVYDERIPAVLLGDSVRLHQIIMNLVSNSIKFTTKGKITVGVLLIDEDDDKVIIEFTVMDTGIGIAENNIAKIFQNFQQATHETSYLYGGTGLGLAIVKQLVEKQGGTVSVVSEIGKGSTFGFTLSFQKTKMEEISKAEIAESHVQLKQINVLVAEDVALNQFLIKIILEDFGFKYEIAPNGKVAIEKLKTENYDIILMDLQMPEMNGFEATEYIRNIHKSDIPIIALTADVTTMDLAKCKSIGMNDYISKPIDENLLYKKMVGLLQNR